MTEGKFKVGDIVILQNLKIHPEFNGLETTVIGPGELRESHRGVEPMPIEYLYQVDINLAGCEPGLLVAEHQMRHRKPPVELGNWSEGLQEAEARGESSVGSDLHISGVALSALATHRNEAPQHLQLKNPVTLECWQGWLREADSATTFHDYPRTFRGSVEITNELQQLLNDFGEQTRKGIFAVRHGIVEGVWLDPYHNYVAIAFRKASGDPEDCVLINSFALPT
jgi:hypothetical protein